MQAHSRSALSRSLRGDRRGRRQRGRAGQGLGAGGADWPRLRGLRHSAEPGERGGGPQRRSRFRGRLVLFADADGATPIEEEAALAEAIAAGADVAVGSRLLAGADRRRRRFRALAGWMFAAVARRLLKLSDPRHAMRLQDVSRRRRPRDLFPRAASRATSSTSRSWPWPTAWG